MYAIPNKTNESVYIYILFMHVAGGKLAIDMSKEEIGENSSPVMLSIFH
jgi:hypothetical protein